MSLTVELTGGPHDGQLRAVEGTQYPANLIFAVAPEMLPAAVQVGDETVEMPTFRRAVYSRRSLTRFYDFQGIH
jgi:hypothetical protein